MVSALPSKHHSTTHSAPLLHPKQDEDVPGKPLRPERPTLSIPIPDNGRNHHRARSGTTLHMHEQNQSEDAKKMNRVLIVLMRRLGSSKTFGENVIFMLNRAGKSKFVCLERAMGRDIAHRRKHTRGSLYAAPHSQNTLPSLYDPWDAGILLHQRSEGTARCLYP